MMNFKTLTLLLIIALFIGCEKKPEPVPPKPVFKTYIDLPDENWPPKDSNNSDCIDLSDFNIPTTNNASQNTIGRASIIGTISFIAPNRNKISGTYSNIYIRNIISTKGLVYGNFLKSAMSDSNGKFEFKKIPNGKYRVSGSMNCGVECGYETNKSITFGKIISLDRNSTYSVNLSNIRQSPRR